MSRWKTEMRKSIDRFRSEVSSATEAALEALNLAQEIDRRTCAHSYVDLERGIIVSARCVKCGELQPGYDEKWPKGPVAKKPRG